MEVHYAYSSWHIGCTRIVAVILWRVSNTVHVVRDIADSAGDAAKWVRRKRWQGKTQYNVLKDIEDPREAAAAMLAAVAEYDGAMTAAEEAIIIHSMTSYFGVEESIAWRLLAHGRWLAQNPTDLSYFLKQLAPAIEKVCTQQEKHQLIVMLTKAASANNGIDDVSKHAISDLKHRFGA